MLTWVLDRVFRPQAPGTAVAGISARGCVGILTQSVRFSLGRVDARVTTALVDGKGGNKGKIRQWHI